jgi:hypothetical protein
VVGLGLGDSLVVQVSGMGAMTTARGTLNGTLQSKMKSSWSSSSLANSASSATVTFGVGFLSSHRAKLLCLGSCKAALQLTTPSWMRSAQHGTARRSI